MSFGIVTKTYGGCGLALAIALLSVQIYPAIAGKLPVMAGSQPLSLKSADRKSSILDRLRTIGTTSIKRTPIPLQRNHHWYGGGSAGISFLGDLDVSQNLNSSVNNTLSGYNIQLRNLGDILGQLDQSVLSSLAKTTVLDRPILVTSTVDRLSPAQVTNLIDRLATNPTNSQTILTEFGISPADFGEFLKQTGTRLTNSQTIDTFPPDLRNNPAQIATLNRLGRDLNSIGELVKRSQPIGTNINPFSPDLPPPIINRSVVRSSSGTGHAAFIGYKFTDFRVETEFFTSSNTLTRSSNSNSIDGIKDLNISGNLANSSIIINGSYDFPVSWTVKPFIGAGIGYSWLTASNLTLGAGTVSKVENQPLFTCQLKAGFALPLSDRTDLLFQYRYLTTGDFSANGSLLGLPINNRINGINLQTLELGARFGL
jgi:opacity protein-like surface antigen